jgi:pilus assembly protein CpaE
MTLAGIRCLALLDSGVTDAAIRAALPAGAPLQVASLRAVAEAVPQLVDEMAPDLVLIGCSGHSQPVLDAIRQVSLRAVDCSIVVLYEGTPNGFVDPAFEAGADDVIVLPQPVEHLAFSLEKVIARRRGAGAPVASAPLISVLGPKGGTGKTLTACNLAVALAKAGTRPIVVDLDLQFGDVGLALGLKPDRTIYDLAVAGGSLDGDKIDSFVVDHPSGVRVLLAPTRPDQAAVVEIRFLREVFELLRSRYDYVIVDTPPAFSPEVIAAIDMSSHLCIVGMLDALSLKDTKIGFETLRQMGYDPDGITLVLNRADTSVGISQDDVVQLLGKHPDVLVPSDRAIPRAITVGQAIVEADPKSGPARAFMALAARYLEARAPVAAGSDRAEHDARSSRRGVLLRKAG